MPKKKASVAVGSWPTPEKPVSIEIPVKFLKEFEKDARVIFKYPYIIGIPVPLVLLNKLKKNPAAYRELMNKFEIMLVPK